MVGSKKVIIPEMVKVGRITQTQAKICSRTKGEIVKAGDIYLSANYLRHIEIRHKKEIESTFLTIEQFVEFVTKKFNQIRAARDGALLLVVNNNGETPRTAIIKISLMANNNYEVVSAKPMYESSMKTFNILYTQKKSDPKAA